MRLTRLHVPAIRSRNLVNFDHWTRFSTLVKFSAISWLQLVPSAVPHSVRESVNHDTVGRVGARLGCSPNFKTAHARFGSSPSKVTPQYHFRSPGTAERPVVKELRRKTVSRRCLRRICFARLGLDRGCEVSVNSCAARNAPIDLATYTRRIRSKPGCTDQPDRSVRRPADDDGNLVSATLPPPEINCIRIDHRSSGLC